jgi:copper resistance protein B
MKTNRRITSLPVDRSVLLVALLLALPLAVSAQSVPAASSSTSTKDMSTMPGMDHGSMDGMDVPATMSSTPKPATKAPAKKARKKRVPPASSSDGMEGMKGMDRGAMPGMDHGSMPSMPASARPAVPAASADTMSGMDHPSMPGMTPRAVKEMDHGATSGMTRGPMQGGSPPPNARSPDYSDGVSYGAMKGMDMADNAPLGMLLLDQLESSHGKDGNGQTWEAEGWYGNDTNKLWIRTEGDRSRGKLEDGDVEAFWNRNVATYWSTQLGVRHDLSDRGRDWAALGIQGLAPYWFNLEATGYVGPAGRTAARLRAEYELLFTQRLILQPEFEVNAYGKSDPGRRIGSDLSDAQLGLRLRYEIRRQFAPYIGVVWTRRLGATADFARDDQQAILDRQWVAGVRLWF